LIATEIRIIVTEGPCEAHGVAHTCIYHRDYPENWAQGENPADAAHNLMNLFEKNLDNVSGARHREALEQAMADIREFLAEIETDPGAKPPAS